MYKQKENRDTKMNKIILTKEIGKEKIREGVKVGIIKKEEKSLIKVKVIKTIGVKTTEVEDNIVKRRENTNGRIPEVKVPIGKVEAEADREQKEQ